MTRETDCAFEWKRTKVHFGVIAAVAVFLLSLLAQDARFSELNGDLLALDRDRRDLEEERDHLMLRREHLTNPTRVRAIATERYGMVAPDPGRVHELR
jgi:cell division protein FtsL